MLQAILALALVGIAAATDLRSRTIPDALNVFGFTAGLVLAALSSWESVVVSLLAACAAAFALYAVRLLGEVAYGEPGMGWGDVKLAAALGALMGWNALWALYLAAVLGAILGVAGRASGRLDRRARVPFAPFIAAGCAMAMWFDAEDVAARLAQVFLWG